MKENVRWFFWCLSVSLTSCSSSSQKDELYAPDWSPRVALVAVDDRDCVPPTYRLRVTMEVATKNPTRINTKDLSIEVDGELCSPIFKRKRLTATQEDPVIYMALSPPLKPKDEHMIRVGYFNSGYTYLWRSKP